MTERKWEYHAGMGGDWGELGTEVEAQVIAQHRIAERLEALVEIGDRLVHQPAPPDARLREALRPFAAAAEGRHEGFLPEWAIGGSPITNGDLFAARDALAASPPAPAPVLTEAEQFLVSTYKREGCSYAPDQADALFAIIERLTEVPE